MKSTKNSPPKEQKSMEQLHYENLISYFKNVVWLTGIALAIIAAAATFVTWNNGKDMRDEQTAARQELSNDLEKMQTSIDLRTIKFENQFEGIKEDFNNRADEFKEESVRQLESFKVEAQNTAREEAKSRIYQVFSERNIDEFVEEMVTQHYDEKINEMVDDKITSQEKVFINQAIENLNSESFQRRRAGIRYFQSNMEVSISDDQFTQLIKIVKKYEKGEWDDVSYDLIDLLTLMKSPPLTDFFKDKLANEGVTGALYRPSLLYCLYNNMEYDNIVKSIESTYGTKNPYSVYFEMVITEAAAYNKSFAFRLMNEEQLYSHIKIYFTNNPNTTFDEFKRNFKNTLSQYIPVVELEKTLLFR